MNPIATPGGGNYQVFAFIGKEEQRVQEKEIYRDPNGINPFNERADSMRGKLDINRIYLSKDGELKTSSNAISHGWRMLTGKATGQAAIKESIRAFVGSDKGALVDKLMTNFNQALSDRERVGMIPGLPGQKVIKGHEKVGWSERSHAFDALKTTMYSAESAQAFPGIYRAAMDKAPAVGKELAAKLCGQMPAESKLAELKKGLPQLEAKMESLNKAAADIDLDDGVGMAAHFQEKGMDVPSTSYFDQDKFSMEHLLGEGSDEGSEQVDPKLDGLVLKGMVDEMKKQIATLEKEVSGLNQGFVGGPPKAASSENAQAQHLRELFKP